MNVNDPHEWAVAAGDTEPIEVIDLLTGETCEVRWDDTLGFLLRGEHDDIEHSVAGMASREMTDGTDTIRLGEMGQWTALFLLLMSRRDATTPLEVAA